MIVYKATRQDMTCTLGKGRFQYVLGEPATAEDSSCGRTGLHACEYVLDCISYYGMGKGNRYFRAEAAGDIAEDGRDTRISCTRLTLLEELDSQGIAREAIRYMVRHPKRDNWTAKNHMLEVWPDRAKSDTKGGIAIARGEDPKVMGVCGAVLGLVQEKEGRITAAKLFFVDGQRILSGVWYTLDKLRELEEEE